MPTQFQTMTKTHSFLLCTWIFESLFFLAPTPIHAMPPALLLTHVPYWGQNFWKGNCPTFGTDCVRPKTTPGSSLIQGHQNAFEVFIGNIQCLHVHNGLGTHPVQRVPHCMPTTASQVAETSAWAGWWVPGWPELQHETLSPICDWMSE